MVLKLVSAQTTAPIIQAKMQPFFERYPFAALSEQDKQTLHELEHEIDQLRKADMDNGYMMRGLLRALEGNIRETQECFNVALNNGRLSSVWLGNYHTALIHLGQYRLANDLLNQHYRSSNDPAFIKNCAKQAASLFNITVSRYCQEQGQKIQQSVETLPDFMFNNERYPSDVLNTLNLLALEYLYQHQAAATAYHHEEEDGDLFITYAIPKMEHDAFWDLDLEMNRYLNRIAIEQNLDNRNIVLGLEQEA